MKRQLRLARKYYATYDISGQQAWELAGKVIAANGRTFGLMRNLTGTGRG